MPLRPQNSTIRLESISLINVVTRMLDCCKRFPEGESEAIRDLARTIPVTLANKYMEAVLFASSNIMRYKEVDIRDAICPWCTRVSVATLEETTNLLVNLNMLRNLTHLWLGWSDCSKENPKIARNVSLNLHGLRKLKSLRMATVVTDEADLLRNMVKFCPDLEELSIKWEMSRNQRVTLANCRKLRRVFVEYCGTRVEDVEYILDSVPQLEILHIPRCMLLPLLQHIRKSYPLKQLKLFSHTHGGDSKAITVKGTDFLTCLARHFPNLDLVFLSRCTDLTPLNGFNEMRNMHMTRCSLDEVSASNGAALSGLKQLAMVQISGIISVLERVKGFCMPNLVTLVLFECDQVDIQQLSTLCPQLNDLVLSHTTVSPIDPHQTAKPFTTLHHLLVADDHESYTLHHFMHLISQCYELISLEVQQKSLDNLTVHRLLQCNPMSQLYALRLTSNRLTPDIATVVFSHFGDHLFLARFTGVLMDKASQEFVLEMRERTQQYKLFLFLGSIVIKPREEAIRPETYEVFRPIIKK